MCLAYERKDHIFKGIGYIFLQTSVKSYDRSETKGLGCFLEKLSKGDIDLERRERFSPLLADVLILKKSPWQGVFLISLFHGSNTQE